MSPNYGWHGVRTDANVFLMDTTTIAKAVGERVTEAMKRSGVNRSQLARAAGKSRTTVINHLNGEGQIGVIELVKMARVTNTDISELLRGIK